MPDEFDALLKRARDDASRPRTSDDPEVRCGPLEEYTGPAACWKPDWLCEDTTGCVVGLTIDDSCYVVLYQHDGGWQPGTHIPMMAAQKIAELEAEKVR